MAEIESIEIINNPEIIEDKPIEIIKDKPIEIIDRRKIKNIKKVEEEPVEKIDKIKILKAPWRTEILEDGSKIYNNKPCDPEYFKKYYHEKRKEKEAIVITCELCLRRVACGHIHRHHRSIICKKNYNLRLNTDTDEKPSEKSI